MVFTRIPRSTSSALRIRARWTTAALQVETVEVVGHPLCAPTDALMTTDEPGLSSGQGLLDGEVSPFEIGAYHHVEALLCHLFERQELAVTCIYEQAVQVTELPLDRGEHRI